MKFLCVLVWNLSHILVRGSWCCTFSSMGKSNKHQEVFDHSFAANMKFLISCLGMALGCQKHADMLFFNAIYCQAEDQMTADDCCAFCCTGTRSCQVGHSAHSIANTFAWSGPQSDARKALCSCGVTPDAKPTRQDIGWVSGRCSTMFENTTMVENTMDV